MSSGHPALVRGPLRSGAALHGQSLRIAVGIATSGRAHIVSRVVQTLLRQTRVPDAIFVSAASKCDVEGLADIDRVALLSSARGLTTQRNVLLDATRDHDILVFFDDDFLADDRYIENLEKLFQAQDDLVMCTGDVLADGKSGPGLSFDEAAVLLAERRHPCDPEAAPEPVYNGYGCNMALRVAPARDNAVRFDEALPLYGWLEDVDFSRRLAPFGRIVHSKSLQGVHMGAKAGRQSGVRLGYSQIANPVYLVGKRTLTWPRASEQMVRNMVMNLIHSFRPEPFIDRRGRLRGNLRGLADLVRGRLRPEVVLSL